MRLHYCFAFVGCLVIAGCQPVPNTAAPDAASDAANPAAPEPPTPAPAQPTSSPTTAESTVIRGRAMYFEKIKLPPGGYLVVQLIDNLLADTPAAVIAQTRLDNVAGSPYDFALPYDPSKLRANGQYGLHAGLYGAKGDLIFVTDTRVPFTPGHQDVGEFRMQMARGAPDRTASPSSAGTSTSNSSAGAFHGVGTEPGWTVDVEPNSSGDGSYSLRADLDYGGRKITVPNAQGLDSTSGFGGKTADGMDVTLRIERASCSDGMSDQIFPAAVKLTVGDKTYSGCGRYLGQ